MRLKSKIWVMGYMRRLASAGIPAYVVRRGDEDAGSIFIRINKLDGTSLLFGPAPAGLEHADSDRRWLPKWADGARQDEEIERVMVEESGYDPDHWLIEVEDQAGRHFLEDWLAEEWR